MEENYLCFESLYQLHAYLPKIKFQYGAKF